MNLALHGLLLQVILSILQFRHGVRLCSAGEPGYLDFDNLPETNFSCQGKVIGGYYADIEAGCQMFHVCTIGQKDEIMDIKFLCLNGTVFDQETRVCERVDEVDCSKSERFYNLNLELYGNNAVTLSLHEGEDEDEEPPLVIEDHPQGTTSSRPSTMSTSTTTSRPSISSTTSASGPYQHPSGYPQHYQPQPPFPSIQTSQSKSLYDDKNGGYHRQYIYHIDNRNEPSDINHNNNDNRATSYQLFSNQGASSTTGAPQVHQIHYSSTPNPQSLNLGNDPSSVSPLFHTTSSTIQTLLTNNGNNPTLINPIFHNNGIVSTTEFTVHSNTPRDTSEYHQPNGGNQDNRHRIDSNQEERRFLEPIQSTSQGKISKLTISPIPSQREVERMKQQLKSSQSVSQSSQQTLQQQQHQQQHQQHQQQHRIPSGFLTIAPMNNGPPAVRTFYPTPKTSSKTQSSSTHITQHIHIPSIPPVPQLKPHQVTINLPPPDIQRIVQNPSPLLPSQSRVIVTAKASVSDESGRPLNTTQLVTLPTVPASYDDYKEGDESFDPFYRDVPKIRNTRRSFHDLLRYFEGVRKKRSVDDENPPAKNEEDVSDEGERGTPVSNNSEAVESKEDPKINDETVEYYEQEAITDKSEERLISNSNEKATADYPADSAEYSADDEYINSAEYSDEVASTEIGDSSVEDNEKVTSVTPALTTTEAEDVSTTVAPESISVTTEEPETPSLEPKESDKSDVSDKSDRSDGDKSDVDDDSDKRDGEVTEGVLKFTDEIPQFEEEEIEEDADLSQDKKETSDEVIPLGPLDYVDDNYEPHHYQEEKKESPGRPLVDEAEKDGGKSADTEFKTSDGETTDIYESSSSSPTTTPVISSTTMSTTTTSTTTPTTTTIGTTVRAPVRSFSTTPAPRFKPTPINLFKAVTTRKTYVYSPPTNTPMPVVIKTRLPLLNPKPAKPPKSYNEIAPKPVIRKVPLVSRRGYKTTLKSELEAIETTTAMVTEHTSPADGEVPVHASEASTSTEAPTSTSSTLSSLMTTLMYGVDVAEEGVTVASPETTESTFKPVDESSSSTETVVPSTSPALEAASDNQHQSDQVTVATLETTTKIADITSSTLASIKPVNRKSIVRRGGAFSCLDVEMYRFYADKRDCRLFHYCSPGFTAKQVLDFRFVCEEGTTFDEISQSCVLQNDNPECQRRW